MSVLLIEHDVRFVASIADSLLVLDRGSVIAEGPVSDVLANPKVIEAYSGVGV
jgi:ABC-type branched-subunit amino acid transport system ATPase component